MFDVDLGHTPSTNFDDGVSFGKRGGNLGHMDEGIENYIREIRGP